MNMMNTGERHAWQQLSVLDPRAVSTRTGVAFDKEKGCYVLNLFNQTVEAYLEEQEIRAAEALGQHLVNSFSYFSRLAILSFLVHGSDIPPSGQLVKPGSLPGMQAMVSGSHTLPLNKLATRYECAIEEFVRRGQELGGRTENYGDASLRLHPFKPLPVVLILHKADDEFPASADLLLDATSRYQMPPDVLWSVMMLSIPAMMQ